MTALINKMLCYHREDCATWL